MWDNDLQLRHDCQSVEKYSIADKTDIMHVYNYTAIAFVRIFSIVVAITFVSVMLDEMLSMQ